MKSEQVAGFVSESMAGFIGIRIHTTRFDTYREKIRGERSEFERDVTRLFE